MQSSKPSRSFARSSQLYSHQGGANLLAGLMAELEVVCFGLKTQQFFGLGVTDKRELFVAGSLCLQLRHF